MGCLQIWICTVQLIYAHRIQYHLFLQIRIAFLRADMIQEQSSSSSGSSEGSSEEEKNETYTSSQMSKNWFQRYEWEALNEVTWEEVAEVYGLSEGEYQKLRGMAEGLSLSPTDKLPEKAKEYLYHVGRKLKAKWEAELREEEARKQSGSKNRVFYINPIDNPISGDEAEEVEKKTDEKQKPNKNQEDRQKQLKLRERKEKKGGDRVLDKMYQRYHNFLMAKEMGVTYPEQVEQTERQRERREKNERKAAQKKEKVERERMRKEEEKRKKEQMERMIAVSRQVEMIEELMVIMKGHDCYQLLSKAKTTPSVKFLLRLVQHRQKSYHIDRFQEEIKRIFLVFYKTSKEPKQNIKAAQGLQQIMFKAISDRKKILFQGRSVAAKANKEQKLVIPKVGRGRGRQAKVFQMQSWRGGRGKGSRKKMVRQWSELQVRRLGKNINRLSKEALQQFCVQFGGDLSEKTKGNATTFECELAKVKPQSLEEMEGFVKRELEGKGREYVDLSGSDVSSDFVIENDFD